jgi:hypothetical protein
MKRGSTAPELHAVQYKVKGAGTGLCPLQLQDEHEQLNLALRPGCPAQIHLCAGTHPP